jgi:hypothetical protein
MPHLLDPPLADTVRDHPLRRPDPVKAGPAGRYSRAFALVRVNGFRPANARDYPAELPYDTTDGSWVKGVAGHPSG